MKNELLERKKKNEEFKARNKEFDSLMADYSIGTKGGYINVHAWDKLQFHFRRLAGMILDFYGHKFFGVDDSQLINESVDHVNKSLHRFDYEKGKAFNWSVTIILSAMRQIYRANKNYTELKEKNAKHLADRQDQTRGQSE